LLLPSATCLLFPFLIGSGTHSKLALKFLESQAKQNDGTIAVGVSHFEKKRSQIHAQEALFSVSMKRTSISLSSGVNEYFHLGFTVYFLGGFFDDRWRPVYVSVSFLPPFFPHLACCSSFSF
jgi:hypothetical protein